MMQAGQILLDALTLAVIIFGALGVYLLRIQFSRSPAPIPTALLIRFSFLLFGFGLLALVEGMLLSQYGFGFGWFAAAAESRWSYSPWLVRRY